MINSDSQTTSRRDTAAQVATSASHWHQRAQLDSDERFRAITEHSRDMIAIVDTDAIVRYHSPGLIHLLGYRPEERIGRSVFEFVHDEDRSSAAEKFRQLLSDPAVGILEDIEIRVAHRNGGWRWLQISGSNLLDHPMVRGVVIVGRDITERRAAEQMLRENERWLDTALWGARVAFWKIDLKADVATLSPQFFEITGIDPDDWGSVRHPWFNRVHAHDRAAMMRRYEEHVLGQSEFYECEYRMQVPKGWLWMLDRGRVVERDSAGRPLLMAGTLMDVSERKALERELVEIATQERRRIGNDLHDGLGQELTGIALMLRGMAARIGTEAAGVKSELDAVVGYVNGAIENVRVLAHGLSPASAERGGLEHALQTLAKLASTSHRIQVTVDSDHWSDVALDEEASNHLYRIAQEALSNAVRHGGARRIRFLLQGRDRSRSLAIVDDGRGMSTPPPLGRGMGLKIMAYRGRMLGGETSWSPGDDGGTRVVVNWPCR
jgi:PAS domain S-box-containing protein